MNEPLTLKMAVIAILAPIGAFIAPTLPLIYLCTAIVITDCISAWRLGRRLARHSKAHADASRFSSRKFGRTVAALARIYAAILLAHGVDSAIFGGAPLLHGLSATRIVAAAIVLWQALSILENEASCSDNRWAAPLRRFLIDKTKRHLD